MGQGAGVLSLNSPFCLHRIHRNSNELQHRIIEEVYDRIIEEVYDIRYCCG